MQHQARIIPRRASGIKRVTQDRVAQCQHMHTQLMRPAGFRHQPHAGFATLGAHRLPVGDGLFAVLMINHLQRPVRPIHDQGQIDGAGLVRHLAPDTRDIGLAGLTLFKLQPQMALGVRRQGKNHHPGRIPIQPMHQ